MVDLVDINHDLPSASHRLVSRRGLPAVVQDGSSVSGQSHRGRSQSEVDPRIDRGPLVGIRGQAESCGVCILLRALISH